MRQRACCGRASRASQQELAPRLRKNRSSPDAARPGGPAMTLRLRFAVPAAALALALAGPPVLARGQDGAEERPEARRARVILRALEAGRVAEAVTEAEGGVRRYPGDPLIRRRAAQAQLVLALQHDAAFD